MKENSLEELFECVLALNNAYGTEFDKYCQSNLGEISTLQKLEDFIGSWYNNYNAECMVETPEELLEKSYIRLEKISDDDENADELNNMQELMIMINKTSDKRLKEFYHGEICSESRRTVTTSA